MGKNERVCVGVWERLRQLPRWTDMHTRDRKREREGGGKIDREIESYKNRHMRTREGTRKKERNVDTCRRERGIKGERENNFCMLILFATRWRH